MYLKLKILLVYLIIWSNFFYSFAIQKDKNDFPKTIFKLGEELKYKMKYGWFTLGKGTININPKLTTFYNQEAYQVHVFAHTAGLAILANNIDDRYYSIISTENIKALYSEKHVKIGKEYWNQWNKFNYDSMYVSVKVKDHRKEDPNRSWKVNLTNDSYGLISTYLYFREVDWGNFGIGDSIVQKVFYEKKLYSFGVEYGGIEYLKLNGNKIKAYKLYLLLPISNSFSQKKSVLVWISADKNKYPIRIQAKMRFGSVKIDLESLNGTDIKDYKDS